MRKPPIRHDVGSHYRGGKKIESFTRGSGARRKRSSRVVWKREEKELPNLIVYLTRDSEKSRELGHRVYEYNIFPGEGTDRRTMRQLYKQLHKLIGSYVSLGKKSIRVRGFHLGGITHDIATRFLEDMRVTIPSQRVVEKVEKEKKIKKNVSIDESNRVGSIIGVDWGKFSKSQFRKGMEVELEHGVHDPQTDVTGGDLVTTGKIVLAHMKEFPNYYELLSKMERGAHK